MDDDGLHARLGRLIAGARRSDGEPARLARRLSDRAWPGGSDRTEPSAREWVRRWGPALAGAERMLPACVCAQGRCGVCN